MKMKAIIGAGGFAREVRAHMGVGDVPFFVDDAYWAETGHNIFPLSKFDPEKYEVVIAIGEPSDRKKMADKLPSETAYFTFIHHSAQLLSNDIVIGKGAIICANSIITTNVIIGDHCHLNLATTIGHDVRIGNFFTTAPGAKISGSCNFGNRVYLGTNASVRNRINICDNVTVGLGSGVVKDITESGVYAGLPAKKIK